MKRKTVPAALLVEITNKALAAPLPTRQERLSICSILEATLIQANAYHGFRYLCAQELEPGILPGIEVTEDSAGWSSNTFPDDSRRHYFS